MEARPCCRLGTTKQNSSRVDSRGKKKIDRSVMSSWSVALPSGHVECPKISCRHQRAVVRLHPRAPFRFAVLICDRCEIQFGEQELGRDYPAIFSLDVLAQSRETAVQGDITAVDSQPESGV